MIEVFCIILLVTLGLLILTQDGSGADSEEVSVSVMEKDSVTLHTDVQTSQQYKIKWYFNDTRIAQISGDLSDICTDVQCEDGDERFRDRLKLDHQTGSLTITHTINTDSGEYKLQIINSRFSEKTFTITVYCVPVAELYETKRKTVKEGKSVTFDPGVKRNPNYTLWYFSDTLIAEITGDQSYICTDVQCKERFGDRLKLDHQTGSLTITHTRTEDSGEYKLQIIISKYSIIRSFSVSVIAKETPAPDQSLGYIEVVVILMLLLLSVPLCVIYWPCRKCREKCSCENRGNNSEMARWTTDVLSGATSLETKMCLKEDPESEL